MFGNILQNKAVQELAFKQLKGLLGKETGNTCIIIGLDADGKIEINICKGVVNATETLPDGTKQKISYGKN